MSTGEDHFNLKACEWFNVMDLRDMTMKYLIRDWRLEGFLFRLRKEATEEPQRKEFKMLEWVKKNCFWLSNKYW